MVIFQAPSFRQQSLSRKMTNKAGVSIRTDTSAGFTLHREQLITECALIPLSGNITEVR